jgi:hypothetical protein
MSLNLDNIINVSVVPKAQSLTKFNLNTLMLISHDEALKNYELGYKTYYSASEAIGDFASDSLTAQMIATVFSQKLNVRTAGGYLVVALHKDGQNLEELITELNNKVYTIGLLPCFNLEFSALESLARFIEAGDQMLIYPFSKESDIETNIDSEGNTVLGGAIFFKANNYKRSRALYYHNDNRKSFIMAAAYASRALSVNFIANRSTHTMHLKELVGIEANGTIDSTLLNKIMTSGADCYVTIAGLNVVYSSGENGYFDQIYNLTWFKLDMAVNYFNTLKTTQYKIAQTEEGLESLKLALLKSCLAAVNNGYIAAGSWQSEDYFGDKELFINNIKQMGFYIYNNPLNTQDASERTTRQAVPIMVAIKEAGAFHKGSLIIGVDY